MTCTCSKHLAPETKDIWLIDRDAACPHHGDGTYYWAKQQQYATDLVERLRAEGRAI